MCNANRLLALRVSLHPMQASPFGGGNRPRIWPMAVCVTAAALSSPPSKRARFPQRRNASSNFWVTAWSRLRREINVRLERTFLSFGTWVRMSALALCKVLIQRLLCGETGHIPACERRQWRSGCHFAPLAEPQLLSGAGTRVVRTRVFTSCSPNKLHSFLPGLAVDHSWKLDSFP